MTLPFSLGAVPSHPDDRDYAVRAFLPPESAPLPSQWSCRELMQPVRHQGAEGACVGVATASGLMGHQQNTSPTIALADREILSPRDVYSRAREIEPVAGEGAYPRAALKACVGGVCLETDRPYFAGTPTQPGPNAEANRARNRIQTYSQVALNPQAIKEALYRIGPSLAVIPVDDGFFAPDASSGIVRPGGQMQGWHAVVYAGWNDVNQCFLLRNSWGTGWGQQGYGWLPYNWRMTEVWQATPAVGTIVTKPWWSVLFPWWSF